MPVQLKKILKELGLKDNAIKVYLALTELGEAPASRIAKKVGLPRTTTIDNLEHLASENFLSTNHYKGMTYYWVESPKTLQTIFDHKRSLASSLEESLSELYRSEANFPFANVYDTQKGIKNFIEKLLINLPAKSIIYTIDAPHQGNYQKIFSEDFNRVLLGLKKKQGIITKTLVPMGTFAVIETKKLTAQNIEIRELPKEINFTASIWFVGNLLVLFSGKPPFVVACHHQAIVGSVKSIYDYFWAIGQKKY